MADEIQIYILLKGICVVLLFFNFFIEFVNQRYPVSIILRIVSCNLYSIVLKYIEKNI